MDIIKEDVFRKQMKKGLSGAYLFFGEEDYLKTHALKSAREAICTDPTFALFNDFHLDAMDYTPAKLLDALVPPPMMSEMKIVSVSGLAISSMRQSELDDLCDVLSTLSEYDYNVLIISVPAGLIDEGNIPKSPSTTLKKLSEYLTPVQFDSIPAGRLATWVGKHFEHHGVKAAPEVCSFLIEYAGKSMYVLASETEKLSYYCLENGKTEVTKKDVEQVSISEIGTDAFSLANSILDGRFDESINALSVMKFRRIDPVLILPEVSRVFCDLILIKSLMESGQPSGEISRILRMNEYKVKLYMGKASSKPMSRLRRAIELCSEADLSLKQSAFGYTSIEKLICSL